MTNSPPLVQTLGGLLVSQSETHFPSWHFVAEHRFARSAWDGEVAFIR